MNPSPWNTALNLLARREYSQHELRTKLQQRYPDDADRIEETLQQLADQGLQNDDRFAEAFVRSRYQRGHGPIRIRFDARQKGVATQVEAILDQGSLDWYELATDIASRKIGEADITDLKVKAKLYRFLGQRGFQPDQIQHCLDTLSDQSD